MNALVVFDSRYGHTEQIAQAIGGAIGCRVRKAAGVDPAGLIHLDLLILGSPTHGGWFTPAIREMLEVWPALDGLQAAAFDTRTDTIWNRILRFGYAAPRLARALEDKGARLLAPPEGFVVLGTKGPLRAGELARARAWATGLAG